MLRLDGRFQLIVPLVLLSCGWGGCASRREQELPAGSLLVADGASLGRLLGRAEAWKPTRLASATRAARQRLAGCERIDGQTLATDVIGLLDSLSCRGRPGLDPLERLRGDHALAFALSLPVGRLLGTADIDAKGGLTADAELPLTPEASASMLLPSAKPPGPTVLSNTDALLHARLRPSAGLAPLSGSRSRSGIFRLKTDLFLGAALSGVWELAVYDPGQGRTMPPLAVALEIRSAEAARAGIEGVIDDAASRWPIRRRAIALGDAAGSCVTNLTILPELAPCYVLTASSLVLGWNVDSLKRALDGKEESDLGVSGGMVIDFRRLAEADRKLGLGRAEGSAETAYPWALLRLTSQQHEGAFRFHLDLAADRP